MTDFTDATFHIQELQALLGLGAWDIRLGAWLNEDDEDANIRIRTDEMCATVRINPKVKPDQVRRMVAHEMAHLLLKDYTRIAMDRRPESVMDILTDLEEVVCNRIATALTGQQWQPTAKKERKWHAPFVTPAIETAYMPEDWLPAGVALVPPSVLEKWEWDADIA